MFTGKYSFINSIHLIWITCSLFKGRWNKQETLNKKQKKKKNNMKMHKKTLFGKDKNHVILYINLIQEWKILNPREWTSELFVTQG